MSINWLDQVQEHFESNMEKELYNLFIEALKNMSNDDAFLRTTVNRLLKDYE